MATPIEIADAIDVVREVRFLVHVSHATWHEPRIIEVFAPNKVKARTGATKRVRSLMGRFFTQECDFKVSEPWWSVNAFRKDGC